MDKRKKIPITEDLRNELLKSKKLFQEMYGREQEKNDENPYIAWALYYDKKNYNMKIINAMRQAKISEPKIYAYYKTGGLMLSKYNQKYLSKKDIREFKYFYDEYCNLVKLESKNSMNIIQFVYLSNKAIYIMHEKFHLYLTATCNDFIRRHLEKHQNFLDYKIKTELDFLGFCSIKILKDIESIKVLLKEYSIENIYSTSRSIFETYLYAVNLANHKFFFENNILKPMMNCGYSFTVNEEEEINYSNLIVNSKKLDNKTSLYSLAKSSPYNSDIELYKSFYSSACQFVHMDALSAKSYFHGSDPFYEIDAGLTAALLGITLASLTLEQFSYINDVKPQYREDIKYLINTIKQELKIGFGLLQSDPLNKNAIFECFINRLFEVK